MASSDSEQSSLVHGAPRSLNAYHLLFQASSFRINWAIAALIVSSIHLLMTPLSMAGGLGGAWSDWLPSGGTSPSTCLSRARQFLVAQRLVGVNSDGTVAYGDIDSTNNTSVFMVCSDLGDRILLLVSGRDVSQEELQRIRTNLANSFRNQP
ncbi:MAG TPA: hypothetical protein V6C63_13855 [Allocoleopsis sp.]